MGSSIEMPKGLKIVCGDMAYDEEKETIECPPSTVNNKKMLPKYRVPMQEGEMEINLVSYSYDMEKMVTNDELVKRRLMKQGKIKDLKTEKAVRKAKNTKSSGMEIA